MNLSVSTFYDKDRLLRFSAFSGLRRIGMWVFFAIASIFVTVGFILQFLGMGIDGTVIFCFVIVWLVDLFYLFSYFVLPRLTVKKMPLLGVKIDFLFLDSIFVMTSVTNRGEDKSTFKYSELHKIIEAKYDLYLYITKHQAFILDKTNLSEEQIKELKDHIQGKIDGNTPKK